MIDYRQDSNVGNLPNLFRTQMLGTYESLQTGFNPVYGDLTSSLHNFQDYFQESSRNSSRLSLL
jgi:hypothetical protein